MGRKNDSEVEVTDLFCGAGGSSSGAAAAGAKPRQAINHWVRAIETHNTNFPDCDHDCADVQAVSPKRYRSTHILIASPECTNHSLAKGAKRAPYKEDLFGNVIYDPSAERSRATMWNVCDFAEAHRYEIIIVENVVDVMRWIPLDGWLKSMDLLGYAWEAVFFNSMFAFPTPQSRDRVYFIFWKKGNKKPDLHFTPPAPCLRCNRVVEARQTWKNGKRWGKYQSPNSNHKAQYLYTCPDCKMEVMPFFYAAMNAIDWSIKAERIGDRKRPLKPKTLERIKWGLDNYGRRPLVVTSHSPSRVNDASAALPTQTSLRNMMGIVAPNLVGMAFTQANGKYVYSGTTGLPTQTTRGDHALMAPSFLTYSGRNANPTGIDEVAGTFATLPHHALISPYLFPINITADRYITSGDPLPTQTTKLEHGLVAPLVVSVNDYDDRAINAALSAGGTQTTQDKWAIAQPGFIAEMHGTSRAAPLNDPLMCIATSQHHALIRPDNLQRYCMATGQPHSVEELEQRLARMTVEDWTFRMLKVHEIQAGMAFAPDYVVKGNVEEQIKQLGNAVTPPVMQMLVERCIQSLEAA